MPDELDEVWAEVTGKKPAAPVRDELDEVWAEVTGGAPVAAEPMPSFGEFLDRGAPPMPATPQAAPGWPGMGPNRENVTVPDLGPAAEAVRLGQIDPIQPHEWSARQDLVDADAMTGQRNAGNPEFRKAFLRPDGTLDPAKTSAYVETIRKAHADAIPAGAAVATHFGRTVLRGTTLGFYDGGLSDEENALLDQNPAVQGPAGQVAGAAGTVLAAANPVGPVAGLSRGARALKIPTPGAVGFGAASGIEHRDPTAALEAYGFAAGAGGIGQKLAGPTAGALRRGASEAVGVGTLATATAGLHGEKPDWPGILAQMGFFGLASAGKVSPLSRAGDIAVRRAEAISRAVPEATPEQVAGWVSGQPSGVPMDMAMKMSVAERPVMEAHKAEVDRESLPPAERWAIEQEAARKGVDPAPLVEKARKPVDLTSPLNPEGIGAAPAQRPLAAPLNPEGVGVRPTERPVGERPTAPVAAPARPVAAPPAPMVPVAPVAPAAPATAPQKDDLTLVGRTDKGVGVYQRPGYQPGDTLVTRTEGGRLGAAHPKDVAEARANAAQAAPEAPANPDALAYGGTALTNKSAQADALLDIVSGRTRELLKPDRATIGEAVEVREAWRIIRRALADHTKAADAEAQKQLGAENEGVGSGYDRPMPESVTPAQLYDAVESLNRVYKRVVQDRKIPFRDQVGSDAEWKAAVQAAREGMLRKWDTDFPADPASGVLGSGRPAIEAGRPALPEAPAAPRDAPKTPRHRLKSSAALEAEATKDAGISQLVRKLGGFKDGNSEGLRGELEMLLSQKESGTTGLLGRKGRGMAIEDLMVASREAGFDIPADMPLDKFIDIVVKDAQGQRTLNPAMVDSDAMGDAALRRQSEEMSARRGAEDITFKPGDSVTGTTREGKYVAGKVVRVTDKSVIIETGSGQKRVAKQDTYPSQYDDTAVSSEGISAGLDALRGGKEGPTPRTSGEAGFLDLPTVGKALAKTAFGAPRVVETGLDFLDRGARGLVKAAAKIPGVSHAVDGIKIAAKLLREKIDPHLLPREYLSRVAEKEGREALTRHDAKDDARWLANLTDGKPLTKDHQETATKFLTKEATREEAVAALGEGYVKRLDTARAEIDARQAELGRLEVLSPETIAKWGGKYLKRMYAVIEAQKAEGEIPVNIPVGGKRIAKVHQRKDISEMMREFLGEIRDPAVLVAQTRMAQEGMIATAKFLKRVAADPRWSSDKPREGLAEEPLVDSKRYGALAGKYLHPRIKADIEATFRDHGGMADTIAQVIDTTLSQWKFGKTVLNPGTHGRNIIGNGFYAALEGNNWADPFNWKHGLDAIKIMSSRKGDPLYDVKRGLIAERVMGGDYLSSDVLETAALVAKARGSTWLEKMRDYMESLDKKAGKGRVFEALPGADKVAALYQLEDVLPKVASYVSKIKGRLGRPAMSHSEAAQAVRDAYPTFDATALGRPLRNMKGLGGALTRQLAPPFLGYTLAAAQTISKQALLHPVRFAAIGAALKWVMYGMSDTDEKTKRIVGAAVPRYKRPGVGAGFLPWNDSNGDRQLLDLRYTVPLGDEFQTIVDWFSDAKGIDDPGLRSIQPGPFVWTAAQLLLNKNALTNRPIDQSQERGIQPNPSSGEGERDMLRFVGQQMLPSLFPGGYSWNKIKEALAQTPIDRRGQAKRDLTLTLLDTIAGVKIRSVNVRRDQDQKLVEIDDVLSGKIQRMRVLADAKNIPEAAKRREYDELQADVMDLYIQSLRVRGLPDPRPGEKIDPTGGTDAPDNERTPRKLFQRSVKEARERLSPGGR